MALLEQLLEVGGLVVQGGKGGLVLEQGMVEGG